MEVMGRHHYGWLCDPITDIVTDHYVGIGNRWTGYVSGGLPVLIDAKWRFMAEYVSRFDAGLVIEEVDSPTIDAKIKAADHARVAAGTRRLARHMVDHNAETLDRVAAAIEEFRP